MLWCFFWNELSAVFPISNIQKEDWNIYFLYPLCFFPAQDLYLSPWTCVRSYAGHPGFTWPALYWESKPQAAFWPFHASPSNMLKLLCGLEFTFFNFPKIWGLASTSAHVQLVWANMFVFSKDWGWISQNFSWWQIFHTSLAEAVSVLSEAHFFHDAYACGFATVIWLAWQLPLSNAIVKIVVLMFSKTIVPMTVPCYFHYFAEIDVKLTFLIGGTTYRGNGIYVRNCM